jgi:hypothetical protein
MSWQTLACWALSVAAAAAQAPMPAQTQSDDYTRYELLAPDTRQFRIVYDVTATTPGAKYYFNVIRKGSEASDESVVDLATGKTLPFEVVSGKIARETGHPTAALDTDYIRIALARPVPEHGEARVRIFKTYKDARSYFHEGDLIVFDRPLSITRNAVVLPAGYALESCNMPSQVWTEPDGRIAIGFSNTHPDPVSLVVKARPAPASPAPVGTPATAVPLARAATLSIEERAAQTREIVYFLQEPSTHAFDLYHDYTETRPGVSRYLNVVRAGSRVSRPSALDLDSGKPLETRILRGDAITVAGLEVEGVTDDTEVVVVEFPPVTAGESRRLRISETYTDPGRYGEVNGQLVWHRTFGRARNALVLPPGWLLTASSMPAAVTTMDDGRVRLDLDNPRPDELEVLVRAHRR